MNKEHMLRTTAATETARIAIRKNKLKSGDDDGNVAKAARPNFFLLLSLPALIVAILFFLGPLIIIVVRSLTSPSPDNYLSALASGFFVQSLGTTLRMSFIVTLLCIVISYPLAFTLARAGATFRALLIVAVAVTFWTSGLVRTFAWQMLLNNTGLINTMLIDTGIIDSPLPLIRNDFAVYVGMAHVLLPFTILTLFAQIRAISPELEKAALSLGASPTTTFFRITLPLSLPGAMAGGVLAFVLAVGFYVTPAVLGSPSNLYVGSAILQQIQVFADSGVGSAQAVILLVVVLIVLAVVIKIVGLDRVIGVGRKRIGR